MKLKIKRNNILIVFIIAVVILFYMYTSMGNSAVNDEYSRVKASSVPEERKLLPRPLTELGDHLPLPKLEPYM